MAQVQAYVKAHGYQHVSEIPKGVFAAVPQPSPAEVQPSFGPKINHIVVPSAPTKDYPPIAVHIGNTKTDALAYSEKLIAYLRTHVRQWNQDFALFDIIWRAAEETGHDKNDEVDFTRIVLRELKGVGVVDASGNPVIQ